MIVTRSLKDERRMDVKSSVCEALLRTPDQKAPPVEPRARRTGLYTPSRAGRGPVRAESPTGGCLSDDDQLRVHPAKAHAGLVVPSNNTTMDRCRIGRLDARLD